MKQTPGKPKQAQKQRNEYTNTQIYKQTLVQIYV